MLGEKPDLDLRLPVGARRNAWLRPFGPANQRRGRQARQLLPLQEPPPTPRINPIPLSVHPRPLSLDTPPAPGTQQHIPNRRPRRLQRRLRDETSLASSMAALNLQQQQDGMDPVDPVDAMDACSDDIKSQCRNHVLSLFPDIDLKYLAQLGDEARWCPDNVIEQILNQLEDGVDYPRAPKNNNLKKRKHQDDNASASPQEAAKEWDNLERRQIPRTDSYRKTRFAPSRQPLEVPTPRRLRISLLTPSVAKPSCKMLSPGCMRTT